MNMVATHTQSSLPCTQSPPPPHVHIGAHTQAHKETHTQTQYTYTERAAITHTAIPKQYTIINFENEEARRLLFETNIYLHK